MESLPSHLDMTRANDFKQHLSAFLADEAETVLDLSGVERASVAILQLLWAAQVDANKKGRTCHFILSPALSDMAKTMGITGIETRT